MAAAHTIKPNMDDVHPTVRLREHRRYEIARDVLAGFGADPATNEATIPDLASAAVAWADALLAELER